MKICNKCSILQGKLELILGTKTGKRLSSSIHFTNKKPKVRRSKVLFQDCGRGYTRMQFFWLRNFVVVVVVIRKKTQAADLFANSELEM
jgi:hypothetical protein